MKGEDCTVRKRPRQESEGEEEEDRKVAMRKQTTDPSMDGCAEIIIDNPEEICDPNVVEQTLAVEEDRVSALMRQLMDEISMPPPHESPRALPTWRGSTVDIRESPSDSPSTIMAAGDDSLDVSDSALNLLFGDELWEFLQWDEAIKGDAMDDWGASNGQKMNSQ